MMIDPEELGRIAVVLQQRGYVSIPKAALLINKHPQTAHDLVRKGHIRHIMVGKRKCITWDEIKRFKDEGNWDPSKYPDDDL